MTLLLAFATLLLGAALCFGLSRVTPTRALGLGAALACFGAGGLALFAPAAPEAPPWTLLVLGEATFSLSMGLGLGERALAAALLGGGGSALLALAGAIAGPLRGFGAIFGWALLCLTGALLSLAAPPLSLVQPLAWAAVALTGYGALRASGAAVAEEAPPHGLSLGLAASALLMATLLAAPPPDGATLPAGPIAGTGLLAVLALAGAPPLLAAQREAVEGPAPLGALLFGLSAPATALGWLLRMVTTLPPLPAGWGLGLGLLGGLGALACGAGALGERRLRPLLGWVAGAQAALVIAAAGLAGPLAALAGPALLLSMMLSTVASANAAVSFERITGSDDYTIAASGRPPRIAGVVWVVAAAASLGLPPLWGLWARHWLLATALEQQPWLVAALLGGAVLLGLALLAPLAGFWAAPSGATRPATSWADWLPAALALAPLLVLGVAPALAWGEWLRGAPSAPATLPVALSAQAAAIGAGAALALLCAAVATRPSARSLERDPDEEPVQLPPEAAGDALRPLAWLARPTPLLRAIWRGLERTSEGLRVLMGLFEQRYYLLGVLAALITIMLLMAQ